MELLKKSLIKENANFIWMHLCENCMWTLKQLKEASGLSDLQLLLAIGWLLREGKIYVHRTEDDNVTVQLAANVYI